MTLSNPTGDAPDAAAKTNSEMYAECQARVEGKEADAECTTDADCTKAGCSSEVCVTTAAAEGLTTACDIQPCFEVLDTCGCNEGRCNWTVKPDAGE